jgi:hypothetical protein
MSTPTPQGNLNEAPVPVPSTDANAPPPARVDTAPSGVTLRMRYLQKSPINTLPLVSMATPRGLQNTVSEPVPASVDTTPPRVTFRMRLFNWSATITFPMLSTATPQGDANAAPVPMPSANICESFPASVDTAPPGVTMRMRFWSVTKMLPLASTATSEG